MLESGHAMVADFGIARAVDAAGGDRLTRHRRRDRHTRVHEPRAGGRGARSGRPQRPVRAGLRPVRDAGRAAAVHRAHGRERRAPAPEAEPRPITQIRPAVPAAIAGVLQRALAKNPADRFSPVAQFADALGQRHGATATTPRRPRRWIMALLTVGAVRRGGSGGRAAAPRRAGRPRVRSDDADHARPRARDRRRDLAGRVHGGVRGRPAHADADLRAPGERRPHRAADGRHDACTIDGRVGPPTERGWPTSRPTEPSRRCPPWAGPRASSRGRPRIRGRAPTVRRSRASTGPRTASVWCTCTGGRSGPSISRA